MPTSATDKARDVSFQQKDEMENVDIILYIGVFFDGTNNNMSQAMVGQYSRRKSLYKKHKKELEARGVESLSAMLAHDRGYWETGDGKGVFNRSDLDKIYGLGKTAKADIDKQAAEYGARSFAGDNQKKYDKAYDKLSKLHREMMKKYQHILTLIQKTLLQPDVIIIPKNRNIFSVHFITKTFVGNA